MMYERFVIWGIDDKQKKVFLALELVKDSFKVDVHVVQKKDLSKELEDQLRNDWVKGTDIAMPPHTVREQKLTADSLLPDDLRVEETGKIRNLQNEWSYLMMQQRLLSSYLMEMQNLKERAGELSAYDKQLFEDCKSFWDRILEQRKEKNITNEKVDEFKKELDSVFDKLKSIRVGEAKELTEVSEKNFTDLKAKIDSVIGRAAGEKRKAALFDELKTIRAEYNSSKLNKQHRFDLNAFINDAFEKLKSDIQSSIGERIEKRVSGLQEVIDKLNKSLDMDRKDLQFNEKRSSKSDSKLEIELRKAKLKMLGERIESKEQKIRDIQQTIDRIKSGEER